MNPEIRIIYTSVLRLFLNVPVAEPQPYVVPPSLTVHYPEPISSDIWYFPYMEIQMLVHVWTDVKPIWDTFLDRAMLTFLRSQNGIASLDALLEDYRYFIRGL